MVESVAMILVRIAISRVVEKAKVLPFSRGGLENHRNLNKGRRGQNQSNLGAKTMTFRTCIAFCAVEF